MSAADRSVSPGRSRVPVGAVRLKERVVYSRALGRLVLEPAARWGYARHRRTGVTPGLGYAAMRKLQGNVDPSALQRLEWLVDRDQPDSCAHSSDPDGLAGGEVDDVAARLREDGFAILERRLDAAACDELASVARAATCTVLRADGTCAPAARFNPEKPAGVRYDLLEEDVLRSSTAQRIVADPSLLAVAKAYLGSVPVQDLVTMWWSAATGDAPSSAAAQQFHFDFDRLRFVKVFVYVTDVDETTGPHVYVRGSHRGLPQELREDRRFADREVLPRYTGRVREIAGPRGTVFLADTRGLHKGRSLEHGHRLVFQAEYASSLFGAPYSRPLLHAPIPELRRAMDQHPYTFQRFQIAQHPDVARP